MPNAIQKWTLNVTDEQSLRLPQDAEILCIRVEDGRPQLWALVDHDKPIVIRKFFTYYSGAAMPVGDLGQYIGSYEINFVFHVFEKS